MNGTCYPDTASALTVFKKSFPYYDGNSANDLVAATVAGSVLTYNINSRQWSSNALASRTGTVKFQSCTVPDSTFTVDQIPVQNVLVVCMCMIMFALGIQFGRSG